MYLLQGDYKKVKGFCNDLFTNGYFEFEFSYVSENERFREIDRYLWESRHECTRFKNRYEGDIVIGLNEWNKNDPNKYFDAFMYFIKDCQKFTHSCILFVEDYVSESLLTSLKKHFDIITKEMGLDVKENKSKRKIGFYIENNEEGKSNV